MHFVAFIPATSRFHAARNAMNGPLPDGTNLRAGPYNITDADNGIREVHRQRRATPVICGGVAPLQKGTVGLLR